MIARFLIICFTLFTSSVFAQLTIQNFWPNNQATHLVPNVLVGGGVAVFGITYQGDDVSQIGKFNNGLATVGLDSGIVLSTDNVNNLVGIGFPVPFINATDPDLLTIINDVLFQFGYAAQATQVQDASIISFYFVPTSDSVQFRYVFGSDEYPNYANMPPAGGFIGQSFNDGFAFFLSGPGIAGPFSAPPQFPMGSENLAVIPGTATPITITSVHGGGNSPLGIQPPTNSAYFVGNPPGTNLNGITTILTAQAQVNPCDTYHIRMSIADGQDRALASAVFLEARSFVSSGVEISAAPSYNSALGDSVLYEGCGDVSLSLTRFGNFDKSDTVDLLISGTATNGVDYTQIPNQVIFQPFDSTITLVFTLINDGITEPPETIIIQVLNIPICGQGLGNASIELTIFDPLPLQVTASSDTTILCTADSIHLNISASGLGPFAFLWGNGDTNSSIFAMADSSAFYAYTVTDACNVYSFSDSIFVEVDTPPFSLSNNGDSITCAASSISFGVEVNGAWYPELEYLWSNGRTDSLLSVTLNSDTFFIVTVSLACAALEEIDTVNIRVYNPPFTINPNNSVINCTSDSADVSITITSGFVPGFLYQWNSGSADSTFKVKPRNTQVYFVTVTDACGVNKDSTAVRVLVANDPIVVNTIAPEVPCIGDSVQIQAFVNGGYPPYSFLWSSGSNSNSDVVNPVFETTYFVSVTDTCRLDTTIGIATVKMKEYPNFTFQNILSPTLNCPGDTALLGPATTLGGSRNFRISWDNFQSLQDRLMVFPLITTFYSVKAADLCTKDTIEYFVTANIANHPPLEVEIPDDTVLCESAELFLSSEVRGGGGSNRYQWNTNETTESIFVKPERRSSFTLAVTDACDEAAISTMRVDFSYPLADFNYDYGVDNRIVFSNLSTDDAVHYLWHFGNGDTSNAYEPIYNYPYFDNYRARLIIQDAFGCIDSVDKPIVPPLQYYIPNAFTPNGDGLNDVFKVVDIGFRYFDMKIFDRWGSLIYTFKDVNDAWDGTINGQKAAAGVYVYRLEIQGFNEESKKIEGVISLLY